MNWRVWLFDLQILLRRLLTACHARFSGSIPAAIEIEVCSNSRLAYDRHPPLYIREYYVYCLGLLRECLQTSPAVNIAFSNQSLDFSNPLPTIRIGLQIEHTLVLNGGRDSAGAPVGTIPANSPGEYYCVRIAELEHLQCMDLVIDYSKPNLVNVASSGLFEGFSKRHTLIVPLLGAIELGTPQRARPMITLFADTSQPRRSALLQDAAERGLPLRNIRGVFELPALRKLYQQTRILINIHQTEHHHTFEELRVLPALLCGVIVICESSPLHEQIPYHEYLIWAPYDAVLDTAATVSADYARYWHRLFGDGRLQQLLENLQKTNCQVMREALVACLERERSA